MHDLAVHEAVVLMQTDADHGLTTAEAHSRVGRIGPNVLPRTAGPGLLARLARQFRHPLIYVLLASAVVVLAVGETVDAAVIAGVVALNATIGFIQESRSQRALEALAALVQTSATVVRDGVRRRVPSADVVPGDLVVLATGDAVVADLRLVAATELRVDESTLTGESLPVHKTDEVLARSTVVADRRNMAFAGTLVTGGEGRGIAVATAGHTEIGLIHHLMGETPDVETPLTRKIAQFSRTLMWAILALAAATYVVGLAQGDDPAELLVAAVALAVAAIPEGLPAAMTITLAIGVGRMARRQAVVRHLPAVETLGSTTVICSDKTGTLTENQMTVQVIVAAGERVSLTGSGYSPAGEVVPADAAGGDAVRACLVAGALCNDARVVERPDGHVEIVGDPTEAALIVAARKAGLDPDRLAATRPRLDTIQFKSERQFMATLHLEDDSTPVAYVKGAVERVVAMCSSMAAPRGPAPIDRQRVLDIAHELGGEGLRVLALARARSLGGATFDGEAPGDELELLGLQAMIDPPRRAAPRSTPSTAAAAPASR